MSATVNKDARSGNRVRQPALALADFGYPVISAGCCLVQWPATVNEKAAVRSSPTAAPSSPIDFGAQISFKCSSNRTHRSKNGSPYGYGVRLVVTQRILSGSPSSPKAPVADTNCGIRCNRGECPASVNRRPRCRRCCALMLRCHPRSSCRSASLAM